MGRLAAALFLLAFAVGSAATDKPNFSGQWRMNIAKSDYGQLPPPDTFVRTIVHAEPMIEIVEEQTGASAAPASTRKMKTDGQTAVQDVNGAEVQLKATWVGAALEASTVIDTFGVAFKDTMSLSDDGKTLISVVQVESAQGNVELKIAFDRL